MGLKTNIIAKDALITKEITRILAVLCQELWAETNMSMYNLRVRVHPCCNIYQNSFFFFVRVSKISLLVYMPHFVIVDVIIAGTLELFPPCAVVSSECCFEHGYIDTPLRKTVFFKIEL